MTKKKKVYSKPEFKEVAEDQITEKVKLDLKEKKEVKAKQENEINVWDKSIIDRVEVTSFHSKPNKPVRFKTTDLLIDSVKTNLNVVEVGCGTGRVYGILKKAYGDKLKYTGYDTSKDMIEKAKSNYPDGSFNLIKDLSEVKTTSKSVILLIDVFQHLDKPEEFINELISKDHAKIVIDCWADIAPHAKKKVGDEHSYYEYDKDHKFIENHYSIAGLAWFAGSKGFDIVFVPDAPYSRAFMVKNGNN